MKVKQEKRHIKLLSYFVLQIYSKREITHGEFHAVLCGDAAAVTVTVT